MQSGSHRRALDSASREKLNVDVESLQAPDHAPVHCYFTGPFFLLLAGVALLYGLGVTAI